MQRMALKISLIISLGIAILTGAGVGVQDGASAQEYRGTMEQQIACTPDVFRLCSEQVPDVNRIVACLRQNTDRLSGPCRAVFDSNAGASDQSAPRRRDNRVSPYDDQ